MKELMPFSFENREIRVITIDGEPWFVGKDVAEALGYKDTVNAIKQHCRGVAKHHPIVDSLGRPQEVRILSEPDVYRLIVGCALPEGERFERWIFEEVIPTIRKTGSYTAQGGSVLLPPSAIQPTKEFRALFGVARLVGMDKNAAALSANQAVTKLTGTNVLQLLGHVHLKAQNQDVLFFTPTELGERLSISGRKVNMLLAEAGLQAKKGECWTPLEPAKDFCRILDTGKRHGDGTMVQQIKWAENVLALIKPVAA